MEIIEYPKALSRGDDLRIVADSDEERAARDDGFRFWSDPPADAAPPETVESLRAKLDVAGIAYDRRFGVDKLASLLLTPQ